MIQNSELRPPSTRVSKDSMGRVALISGPRSGGPPGFFLRRKAWDKDGNGRLPGGVTVDLHLQVFIILIQRGVQTRE